MKFVQNFEDYSLGLFRNRSHAYEEAGLSYWCTRLGAEVTELDLVQIKVKGLKEQVLEVVSSKCSN